MVRAVGACVMSAGSRSTVRRWCSVLAHSESNGDWMPRLTQTNGISLGHKAYALSMILYLPDNSDVQQH